jgi:hypothetical protein
MPVILFQHQAAHAIANTVHQPPGIGDAVEGRAFLQGLFQQRDSVILHNGRAIGCAERMDQKLYAVLTGDK